MTAVTVAYRVRGSLLWTHRFRVTASEWVAFYRHARRLRDSAEYARVASGGHLVPVL